MENGEIPDDKITQPAGTHKANDPNNAPLQARLNNPTGNTWIAESVNVAKLEVDLIDLYRILGIDAHGNNKFPDKPMYPTYLNVGYLSESSSWQIAFSVSI